MLSLKGPWIYFHIRKGQEYVLSIHSFHVEAVYVPTQDIKKTSKEKFDWEEATDEVLTLLTRVDPLSK